MRKTNNPQTALGFSLLNWFVVLCAPEPGKELFERPARRYWLAVAQHAPEVFAQRIALDC